MREPATGLCECLFFEQVDNGDAWRHRRKFDKNKK